LIKPEATSNTFKILHEIEDNIAEIVTVESIMEDELNDTGNMSTQLCDVTQVISSEINLAEGSMYTLFDVEQEDNEKLQTTHVTISHQIERIIEM